MLTSLADAEALEDAPQHVLAYRTETRSPADLPESGLRQTKVKRDELEPRKPQARGFELDQRLRRSVAMAQQADPRLRRIAGHASL